MNMIVPFYVRWIVLALLALACAGLGWTFGADHVQAKWDADSAARAEVAAKQAVKVARVEAAQENVSREEGNNVQADFAAVRSYYADRVRQPAQVCPGSGPKVARSAGSAPAAAADPGSSPAGDGIRVESYDQLAARCAETTVIARGWQRWWDGVEKAHAEDD